MLTVSGLYIYPVKSLGGIAVQHALVTSRGLQYDRRLMLVDEHNRFLTQREHPEMALLQPVPAENGFTFYHKKNTIDPLFVPAVPADGQQIMVTVWDDTCAGILYGSTINKWFSQALGMACRLVYMPDTSNREVDKRYAVNGEITSFADGYPTLLIGQASLDDLNVRLLTAVPMNRFRPSIVFTGGDPYLEDQLHLFTINTIAFTAVKPCTRCVLTTINQDDGSRAKEPLKTLASYRQKNNKILFGQNLLHQGAGVISLGDTIQVNSFQPAAI